MSLGAVVVVVLAVLLLVTAGMMLRRRDANPWPPVVTAMVASGICFTVGGDTDTSGSGPSVATVAAAVVGVLSVVAAIWAMIPRSRTMAPSRVPILVSTTAIVIGAGGLVLNLLTS